MQITRKTSWAHVEYSTSGNHFVYLNNKAMTRTRTRLMTSEIDNAAMYAFVEQYSALLTTGASEKKKPENTQSVISFPLRLIAWKSDWNTYKHTFHLKFYSIWCFF
jgi:hypothetical protein